MRQVNRGKHDWSSFELDRLVTVAMIRDRCGDKKIGRITSATMHKVDDVWVHELTVEFSDEIVVCDSLFCELIKLPSEIDYVVREHLRDNRDQTKTIKRYRSTQLSDEDLAKERIFEHLHHPLPPLQFGQVYQHKRNGTRIFVLHPCVDLFGQLRDSHQEGCLFVYRNLATKSLGARSVSAWIRREHTEWDASDLTENERAAPF